MSLLELTTKVLNGAAFIYLLACFAFIIGVSLFNSKSQRLWLRIGTGSAYLGFAAHTVGLLLRWYLGGIGRPPWTNLYESLVFFSWGVSLLQVIGLRRLKMPVLGLIASPLIFVLMGMSVMTPNKLVEPLIPALQSNWLKIHVVFGMLSYAGFTIAACFAFLHLLKNRYSLSKILGALSLMALINIGVAAGRDFFSHGDFTMTKTVQRELPDGSRVQSADTYREYEGGPILTRVEVVPGAALSCGIGMLAFLLAAAFALRSRGAAIAKNAARFYALGLVSQVALFACIGRALATSESLTLHSNTYLLFLLLMTFVFCGIFVILWWRLEKFLTLLPSAQRLDELSYKNILFAFPFQTLLLVTGAIWAYYAWGRSWGWDPKETWAFITWVAYLIYLHGKLLLRWSPNLLSIVSLIGFFILVFAFLGVNLVLSGLHSYGSV